MVSLKEIRKHLIAAGWSKWSVNQMTRDELNNELLLLRTHETAAKYRVLLVEIQAVEQKLDGVYICDECIDRENAMGAGPDTSLAFWEAMYSSLCSSAGDRCEEMGYNINELLGKSIY